MEKVKIVVICCFISIGSFAQESIIKEGLLRAQLTISPSTLLSDNESYFYLHGNLEGYISDKISISGEGYYFWEEPHFMLIFHLLNTIILCFLELIITL
jgi:hypothetical protein